MFISLFSRIIEGDFSISAFYFILVLIVFVEIGDTEEPVDVRVS